MSYKNTGRAVAVQEEVQQSLMCKAHGCPMKWSVQTGEVMACSYHAWEDTKKWPRITDDIRHGIAGLRKDDESYTSAEMKSRVKFFKSNLADKL